MSFKQSIWNRPISLNWKAIGEKIKTKLNSVKLLSTIEAKKKQMVANDKKDLENKAIKQFPIDLYQTTLALVVKTPLAVKPEDAVVEVGKNSLTINVKRLKQNENTDIIGYHHNECLWGEFSRTINLPLKYFELNKIKANVEDGFLTVILPKTSAYQNQLILLGSLHPKTNNQETQPIEEETEKYKKNISFLSTPIPWHGGFVILFAMIILLSIFFYFSIKNLTF